MWWETFNHFGWVYCGTNTLGQMLFCIEGLHGIIVNRAWAAIAPRVSQHLLEQHIEHTVLHLAGRFAYPCRICNDQRVVLQNIETFNPSVDLAFIGFREGYIDDRLRT